ASFCSTPPLTIRSIGRYSSPRCCTNLTESGACARTIAGAESGLTPPVIAAITARRLNGRSDKFPDIAPLPKSLWPLGQSIRGQRRRHPLGVAGHRRSARGASKYPAVGQQARSFTSFGRFRKVLGVPYAMVRWRLMIEETFMLNQIHDIGIARQIGTYGDAVA